MLKIILLFITKVIFENPFKMLAITCIIVTPNLFDNYKTKIKEETPIITSFMINNDRYVVTNQSVTDNQSELRITGPIIGLKLGDSKLIKKDNKEFLVTWRDDGSLIFLYVLFTLSLIFIFVIIIVEIINEWDMGWWFEFGEKMNEVLNKMVVCSLEDGKYYYTIFGRLIEESNRMRPNHHEFALDIFSLKRYPKFMTKSEKRNKIIEILIG